MFRRNHNRAILDLRIHTVTPLLIRAGDTGLDPSAADITCVRTRHGTRGPTVYIPGSSLKGVLRTAAEAMVRGRSLTRASARLLGTTEAACDDPLDTRSGPEARSCGGRLSTRANAGRPSHDIHRDHCLTCRLFGSLAMKSRISPRDLLPWRDRADTDNDNATAANNLELRHGVAIDRLKGSVKHGPFDLEVVPPGVDFFGECALIDYQVWQLGLFAGAIHELDAGFAQLGSSTSRGLGVVRIHVERIVHEQAGHHTEPRGVGRLASEPERQRYGLATEHERLPTLEHAPTRRGLAMRFEPSAHEARAWLDAGTDALGHLLENPS